MKLGYIRVSTQEQHPERQIEELKKYEIEDRFLFIDYTSGRAEKRPQFEALKTFCRKGDEIYVHELDRLGRTKKIIYDELNYFKEQGVLVRILNVPTTLLEFDADNTIAMQIMDMLNNLLIEVMATFAEQELDTLHKRQAEGIKAAKNKGIRFGRPPRYDFKKKEEYDLFHHTYMMWKKGIITAAQASRDLDISGVTFYKKVKQLELLKNTPSLK